MGPHEPEVKQAQIGLIAIERCRFHWLTTVFNRSRLFDQFDSGRRYSRTSAGRPWVTGTAT